MTTSELNSSLTERLKENDKFDDVTNDFLALVFFRSSSSSSFLSSFLSVGRPPLSLAAVSRSR